MLKLIFVILNGYNQYSSYNNWEYIVVVKLNFVNDTLKE